MGNLPQMLALFSSQLTDPDSYLYLAAINGLAALGDVEPRVIVPQLTREYG